MRRLDRLLAREYHAHQLRYRQGDLARAVSLYNSVKGYFEDARDALAFLTKEELTIPETVSFGVGENVRLPVKRKNLKSLYLRIYEVDLMLLIAVVPAARYVSSIGSDGRATGVTATGAVRRSRAASWRVPSSS